MKKKNKKESPEIIFKLAKEIIKINWTKKGINYNEAILKENLKNERLLEVKALIEEAKHKKYKKIEEFWWDLYYPEKRKTKKTSVKHYTITHSIK